MFDLPNEHHADKALEKQCKRLFRSWRYHLRKETFKKHKTVAARLSNRPAEVDPASWEWLVTVFWESSQFRRRSEINTENQSGQKMLAKVGTKSIARSYHEMQTAPQPQLEANSEDPNHLSANDLEPELPEYLRLWLIQKKKADGIWTDDLAEQKYMELLKLHEEELAKHGVDNLCPREAYTRVLNHRSGYQRGMGAGVLPFFGRHNQGPSEVEIEARIQAEVGRRMCGLREVLMAEMRQEFLSMRKEFGYN